jgi:hypothetical protein
MPRSTIAALVLLLSVTGCATLFGTSPRQSREEAIAACRDAVPAEAVPYADAFADCMEARGWAYTGATGPRQ